MRGLSSDADLTDVVLFEPQVGDDMSSYSAEQVSAGLHHVAVLASPAKRRLRKAAAPPGSLVVLAWGRGAEGQLGGNARSDNAGPKVVGGSLKGRQILQVLMTACLGIDQVSVGCRAVLFSGQCDRCTCKFLDARCKCQPG